MTLWLHTLVVGANLGRRTWLFTVAFGLYAFAAHADFGRGARFVGVALYIRAELTEALFTQTSSCTACIGLAGKLTQIHSNVALTTVCAVSIKLAGRILFEFDTGTFFTLKPLPAFGNTSIGVTLRNHFVDNVFRVPQATKAAFTDLTRSTLTIRATIPGWTGPSLTPPLGRVTHFLNGTLFIT